MVQRDKNKPALDQTAIVLKSDFVDYYDDYFDMDFGDGDAHVFRRMRSADMPHDQIMPILMKRDLPVPMHGLVKHMRPDKDALVMVYFGDTDAPRGESCQVVPLSEAKVEYPECFAVRYVGRLGAPSVSYRILHVGERTWNLRYESDHLWSSHQGNVKVSICPSDLTTWRHAFRLPLCALDYVNENEGEITTNWWRRNSPKTYYVDMTRCPVIGNTPIAQTMRSADIADLIKKTVIEFRNQRD